MNDVCLTFWPYLIDCMNSLRSAVCKNSMIFAQELFSYAKAYKQNDDVIYGLVPTLLMKSHSDHGFQKAEAQKAVEILIECCVYDSTIQAFSNECIHKNSLVSEIAIKAVCKLIHNFGENISKLNNNTLRDIFVMLATVTFSLLKQNRSWLEKELYCLHKPIRQPILYTKYRVMTILHHL